MALMGVGQCVTTDPLYPNGCPSGYTVQEQYYVPNSEVQNVTASTPGAVPLVIIGTCPEYSCVNSSNQTPYGVSGSQCVANQQKEGLIVTAAVAGLGLLMFGPIGGILSAAIGYFGFALSPAGSNCPGQRD